jgi:hypothetical protein
MKSNHLRLERVAAALAKRRARAVSIGARCLSCGQSDGAMGDPSLAALLEAMTLAELQQMLELRDRLVAVRRHMVARGALPSCPECGRARPDDLNGRANVDEGAELERVWESVAALQLAVGKRLAVATAR